jgi:hypothetical protein
MTIGAVGSNASLWMQSAATARNNTAFNVPNAESASANPAGALSILPSSHAMPLSFETVIALQKIEDDEPATIEPPSPTEIFLEEARKSPIERMREQILEEFGLTEDLLAQLPPEERRAIEDQIREKIEEKFRQANNAGARPGANAEMLEAVS